MRHCEGIEISQSERSIVVVKAVAFKQESRGPEEPRLQERYIPFLENKLHGYSIAE